MNRAVIKRISSVEPMGIVGVELYGMRNDLSLLFIDTKEIEWFGINKRGESVMFLFEEGVEIFFDEIHTPTRRIIGVSFENKK